MTVTAEDRIRVYLSQTGRKTLTHKQSRRIIQKRLRDRRLNRPESAGR